MGRLGVLLSGGAASAFQRIELTQQHDSARQRADRGTEQALGLCDEIVQMVETAFLLISLRHPIISCLNDRRVRTAIAFRSILSGRAIEPRIGRTPRQPKHNGPSSYFPVTRM